MKFRLSFLPGGPVLCLFMTVALVGCGGGGSGGNNTNDNQDNGQNNNDNHSNGGGGDISQLNPVLTGVLVAETGGVEVGDDVVAVGTTDSSGVQYLIPSQNDTEARTISNIESFMNTGFCVAGHWIIMRNFDGEVFAFNAQAGDLHAFDSGELALFAGAATPGSHEFWCDGEFAVVVADHTQVVDGAMFKVIDFSGEEPLVTGFVNPPEQDDGSRSGETIQLAIDAGNHQFVAQIRDRFALYDINDSSAEPQILDVSQLGGATNATHIVLDDGVIVYHAFETTDDGRRFLNYLDIASATVFQFEENPTESRNPAFVNGQFGYFVDETDADQGTNRTFRSVFGQFNGGLPEYTLISSTDTAIGDDPALGLVGYGCSVAITPDLRYRFIAGCGTVGNAEYLQVDTGDGFEVLSESADTDPNNLGFPAAEVRANNNVAAFVTLPNNELVYIALN